MEHTYQDLIRMPKYVDGPRVVYDAPIPGKALSISLMSSEDRSCKFILTVFEGKRNSALILAAYPGRKTTLQTRQSNDVLVRVDIDPNAKHTNPDDSVIEGSHVHIAREGERDAWAFPFGSAEANEVIGGCVDVFGIFECFRSYCNIESKLQINWSLGI